MALRLSAFTDYSLRLLIYLSAAPGQRATIAEVARAYRISEHHMVKIVHLLGKKGFVANRRGRGGGVKLALPPSAIVVGDVVRATEGAPRPAECFDAADASRCALLPACRLRRVLQQASDGFLAVLDGYTLEDLRVGQARLESVLHWHPRAARRAGELSRA